MTRLVSTGTDTTLLSTVRRGPVGSGGYRRLERSSGEPYQLRRDLGGAPPGELRPLVCFLQLSDLHVTDAQSPARAEFLDRFGDGDSPFAALVGRVGLYRAQEALSAQVLDAMCRAAARVERGPLTGAPVEFALSTGDATDNCQENELGTYLALLDGGGQVCSDSGERGRFQGVGALEHFDARYWHPDGSPDGELPDLPRRNHGFPLVPGLLGAAVAPFRAGGLPVPWYAVYGNHDALFGGTLHQHEELRALATGGRKPVGLAEGGDPLALLADNRTEPARALWGLLEAPTREVAADAKRGPVSAAGWIAAHLASSGSSCGHGLGAAPVGRCYYAFDAGIVRVLVLDTVNPSGGWEGSLDEEQFAWLEAELVAGSTVFSDEEGRRVVQHVKDRLFLLVSHHPLETLINGFVAPGSHRHTEAEVAALLGRFPNLIAWVNGHTHCNRVRPVPPRAPTGGPGFWQITTASHIDWPQQSRVIEVALDTSSGDIVIGTAMIDHLGLTDPRSGSLDEPATLAGWSRELAANAWQGRINGEPMGRGVDLDRNVVLVRPAPFGLAP
jgi:metallophosphoesterase (TIGR03767 family)